MTPNVLETRNLSISFPAADGSRLDAARDVSLSIAPGEIVGLAGESGSGKTVTALSLLSLLPSGGRIEGKIFFNGRDLTGLDRRGWEAVRGREIAMVFQDPMTALHPMLSIGRQMTEHLRHHRRVTRAEADARAVELLGLVRIPDPDRAAGRFPHQFSGGMRQRIAIAIALSCGPRLLIADEPTTALDVTVQAGFLRLLAELRSELGLSVLLITHDLGVMSALADRVYVMYAGRIVEHGPRAEVLARSRHPYTRGLLDALPRTDGAALSVLPGIPPGPGQLPPGCAFNPRCRWAETTCATTRPLLAEVAPGHRIACAIDPLVRVRA